MTDTVKVMTGNDACVEGALAAGMNFFAGYPITPSTEIAEGAARSLPKTGGRFIQMEDELASIGAVIGASLAGAKAMTATSGPGFSLMQENLGFAVMAEVPCVIVDVMRPGPSSGIGTEPAQGDVMQSRWGTHGDHPIIVLAPKNVQEACDLTIRAFNLAETYRTPVVVLSDAMIGHLSEKIQLPDPGQLEIAHRKRPTVSTKEYIPYQDDGTCIPPMATYGDGYMWYTTGIIHDETGFPATGKPHQASALLDRLHQKIEKNLEDILSFEEDGLAEAEVAVVSYGSVSWSAHAAVKKAQKAGLKVGHLRPLTLWPFGEERFCELGKKMKAIIVVEQNRGQLYHSVREAVAGSAPVHFFGQYNGKLLTWQQVYRVLKEEI